MSQLPQPKKLTQAEIDACSKTCTANICGMLNVCFMDKQQDENEQSGNSGKLPELKKLTQAVSETVIPVSQSPDWANRPVMPTSTGNPVNVTYESLHKIREIFEQADAENFNWQADSMVSYDIDDLSIEQLRHGYRCLLLSGRESHLLHMKDKAAIATRLLEANSTAKTLLDALLNALPYVEDVLSNPAELACFKKGVVQKHATQIRAAIALAEKHENSQPPQVTKSELLNALERLVKMNGHRDPISDKLLPSDLQPELEVAAAMRLVFRAGGAV